MLLKRKGCLKKSQLADPIHSQIFVICEDKPNPKSVISELVPKDLRSERSQTKLT